MISPLGVTVATLRYTMKLNLTRNVKYALLPSYHTFPKIAWHKNQLITTVFPFHYSSKFTKFYTSGMQEDIYYRSAK